MPGLYSGEFREGVVAVARCRESGVTIKRIAVDFGVSEAMLESGLCLADVEEGNRSGPRCWAPGAAVGHDTRIRRARSSRGR